jgi:hypothetical protein
VAYPPPRLVELAYGFDNRVLESICRDDWTSATEAFHRHILPRYGPPCVDRPLPSDAASRCEVIMVMDDGAGCVGLADEPGPERTSGWSVDRGIDWEGNHVCEILPADHDGDACPDGAEQCPPEWVDYGCDACPRAWATASGGLDGWLIDRTDPECEHGELRFTDRLMLSFRSTIRLECFE